MYVGIYINIFSVIFYSDFVVCVRRVLSLTIINLLNKFQNSIDLAVTKVFNVKYKDNIWLLRQFCNVARFTDGIKCRAEKF